MRDLSGAFDHVMLALSHFVRLTLVTSLARTDRFRNSPRSLLWRDWLAGCVLQHPGRHHPPFLFCEHFFKGRDRNKPKVSAYFFFFFFNHNAQEEAGFFDMLQVPLWSGFRRCLPVAGPDTPPTEQGERASLQPALPKPLGCNR